MYRRERCVRFMKVRVKFAKYGALRYIGHLDVMRFFQKALRRAEIDVVYTTGFSPHQVMSFASPLGIGMISTGEYMDIELNSHNGSADFVQRLQAVCPAGIDILAAKELPENARNAMASLAAATYAIAWKDQTKNFNDYTGQVEEYLKQSEIMIEKETKRSTTQMNIRPGIYDFHIEDGCLVFTVDASSAGNIRPGFVTDTFFAFVGISPDPLELQVCRAETFYNAGTPEEVHLKPLIDAGEDF